MKYARFLILTLTLLVPYLPRAIGPVAAYGLHENFGSNGVGAVCAGTPEQGSQYSQALPPLVPVSDWTGRAAVTGALADLHFQKAFDDGYVAISGYGSAHGGIGGRYGGLPCKAGAEYDVTIDVTDGPAIVTWTGEWGWSGCGGNAAVAATPMIGGAPGTAISMGVPTRVEEGEVAFTSIAQADGCVGSEAHFSFSLSVSSASDVTVSIGDVSDVEGNSGMTAFEFPVTLSETSTDTVTVGYETQDDSATAGSDYVGSSGSLSFAPGEQSKTISIQVVGDTSNEPDEMFNVVLSSPVNATISNGTGIGSILNDDDTVEFDWTVPDRFDGQDHNGDGLADYFAPDGPLEIDPGKWEVDFTYKDDGSCDSGLDQHWYIDGIEIAAGDSHTIAQNADTCTFSYGFTDEGKYSVELELREPDGTVVGSQQQDVVVQDWLIVSIGDSVASGEGNPDIPGARGAQWENNQCHRSATAGPAQAAADIELADPKTSVTFIHLACSGATIFKGVLGSYDGITGGRPLPPQLQALKAFVGDREIDAVLVSIGANDVHFSDVVQGCLLQRGCDQARVGTARTRFERDLTRLPSAYDQLATALNLLPLDPQRVYITQYYDPMHDDTGQICADSVLGDIPVLPRLGFSITGDEATWASTNMLPSLNAAVASSALNHGWNFVDGILPQFIAHGYCANDHWVVRFRESLAHQGDTNGTIHPNASGHQVYGNAIDGALTAAFYANGDLSQPRLPASATP